MKQENQAVQYKKNMHSGWESSDQVLRCRLFCSSRGLCGSRRRKTTTRKTQLGHGWLFNHGRAIYASVGMEVNKRYDRPVWCPLN